MVDLVRFLYNNRNFAVYTGGNTRGIYCYIDIIGGPKTLTTSGQRSHSFGPSYDFSKDIKYIQPVIADLRMR